jgi:transposase-like protein
MKKFGGFFVFDGKYLSVKGYRKDIPIIWGADYQTHDIPHFMLVPSESYVACKEYFTVIKNLGYNLKYLVSDDNNAIRQALEYVYPNAVFQLCLNHYKESIRRNLGIRSSEKYRKFFFDVESLFNNRLDLVSFSWKLVDLYKAYGNDSRCLTWIEDLMIRRKELTNYHQFEGAPNTTNLIESYNSQLEQRTKAIKGFQSFKHAKDWLNGFVLRRRFSKFTDCDEPFKHLNGKSPIENTKKDNLKLPNFI